MTVISVRPYEDLSGILSSLSPGEDVRLSPGVYRAKAMITAPGVTITGAGAEKTIIVWDDYARKPDSRRVLLNTFRSWTLAVCADGVTLRDLAVVNDSLHPEERGQEVALSAYADGLLVERCRLSSTQDTLFTGPLPPDLIARYAGFLPDPLRRDMTCRQRYSDCLIEGTVDFIFGGAEAEFDRCEIRSLVDARGTGFAAAPSHSEAQTSGFHFKNCRFTCEGGVPAGSVYLARPWRDYGLCVFEDCVYGPHISPLGFDKWSGTARDRTARFHERPPVPGRVPWVRK